MSARLNTEAGVFKRFPSDHDARALKVKDEKPTSSFSYNKNTQVNFSDAKNILKVYLYK